MEGTAQLDVRVIPPREKHPTIFRTFDALAPGEAFVLVNDHDPFPLRLERSSGSTWRPGRRSGASASRVRSGSCLS